MATVRNIECHSMNENYMTSSLGIEYRELRSTWCKIMSGETLDEAFDPQRLCVIIHGHRIPKAVNVIERPINPSLDHISSSLPGELHSMHVIMARSGPPMVLILMRRRRQSIGCLSCHIVTPVTFANRITGRPGCLEHIKPPRTVRIWRSNLPSSCLGLTIRQTTSYCLYVDDTHR